MNTILTAQIDFGQLLSIHRAFSSELTGLFVPLVKAQSKGGRCPGFLWVENFKNRRKSKFYLECTVKPYYKGTAIFWS